MTTYIRARLDYLKAAAYWLVLGIALIGMVSAKITPVHMDAVQFSGIMFSILVLKFIR